MDWHAKNTGAYARESTEAYENAVLAWGVLQARGWSLLAFCGMWGNVGSESGYNPWRWQSDIVLPEGDPRITYQNGHAYGLCQWDPADKYISGGTWYSGYRPNYSDRPGNPRDGQAQMEFLEDTAVSSGQYFPNPYYNYQISYDDYKLMTLDDYTFEYATRAWFHNYERGTWDNQRTISCEYFYYELLGVDPPPPSGSNIPIWLLFKMKYRNEGKDIV